MYHTQTISDTCSEFRDRLDSRSVLKTATRRAYMVYLRRIIIECRFEWNVCSSGVLQRIERVSHVSYRLVPQYVQKFILLYGWTCQVRKYIVRPFEYNTIFLCISCRNRYFHFLIVQMVYCASKIQTSVGVDGCGRMA